MDTHLTPVASQEAAAEQLVGQLTRTAESAETSERARREAERLRFALACFRTQRRTVAPGDRLEQTRMAVAESVLAHHVARARRVLEDATPDETLERAA